MSASTTLPAVTEDTFAAEVGPGTGFVAVEFTAAWCAPCRVLGPILESIAQEYAGRLRVLQIDADANPVTMTRLGVRGLPTVLVFRDGTLVDRIVGAAPKAAIVQRLGRLFAAA